MSTNTRERSQMSPEADIEFMEDACLRIADAKAPGAGMKRKVDAVIRALRTREWEPTENRVYEWIKKKARRVDGFEKDRARTVLEEIEAENERRKNTEHALWLRSQIAGLREGTSDPDLRGPHIDALERLVSRLSGEDGPVEISNAITKEETQ